MCIQTLCFRNTKCNFFNDTIFYILLSVCHAHLESDLIKHWPCSLLLFDKKFAGLCADRPEDQKVKGASYQVPISGLDWIHTRGQSQAQSHVTPATGAKCTKKAPKSCEAYHKTLG